MVMGLLLGVLCVTPPVIAYALAVRWADRFEPEPWWLLLLAFFYGASFATLGGGFASTFAQSLAAVRLHVSSASPGMEALGATLLAPVFEELFKGFGLALVAAISAAGLMELDGPLDGVIYGGTIGLGFTLTEDILYVAASYAREGLGAFAGLFVLRTIFLGLSHCTFTALTGLGFGLAAEAQGLAVKVSAPLLGLLAAVALHSVHNALPTYFGGFGTALMVLSTWAVNLAFFALLAMLVVRDRGIVVRELESEVGKTLHLRELALVASYVRLGAQNLDVLREKGWRAFRARRAKQLALVELAFIKSRRRRGQTGPELDTKEARLRAAIAEANQRGVWLGA